MAVHEHKTFTKETVLLDGHDFNNCEFHQCILVYKAQEPVKLEHCHFVGCTWRFEDAAQRAVSLLKALYVSGAPGKEIVDGIFRHA